MSTRMGVAAGGSAYRSVATVTSRLRRMSGAREPARFRKGKKVDAPIRAMLEQKIKETE